MPNITKIKYVCSSYSSGLKANELQEKGFPVYGAAGIMGYNSAPQEAREYLGIVKDGAGVGRVKKYPADSSLLGTMAYIIPNQHVDIDWLKYVIESKKLGVSVDKATIPHIYFSDYGNSIIDYPNYPDQIKMGSYLNKICSKIDEAISRNNQIVEKLEEYRKAVITQAVTKGLNPNVEMRESGERWIGKVPNHWNLSKYKFSNRLRRTKATDKTNYIGLENIESFTGKKVGDNSVPEGDAMAFEKGDVLFGKLRPYLSKSLAVLEKGCCSGEILVLSPKLTTQRFLLYMTLSQDFVRRVDDSTYGTKMPRANWDFIGNLLSPIPPLKEQEAIVEYLDKKCTQIDMSIQKQKNIVAKLEEYKKSLIYNAVTGKIEV